MNPGDEKKLKDLTDRLMSMSPEPPPFPEETVVTNTGNQPRRTSPFLVFAGAAVVVLIAIGIPFLFLDNDPPVAAPDTSTTTTSTSTTLPGETTTTPPADTTTTTEDGTLPVAGEAVVYLLQSPENSFLDNPALVPFATPAFGGPDTDLTLYALQLLTPVDAPIVPPDGFFNAVPEGVEIVNARVPEGAPNVLILEMSESFLDGSGTGLLGDFTMLNQLIYTATQGPDIDEVQFIVNNQPVTEFGTEGLDLSGSVNRETFRGDGSAPNIALINLTSPILPDQDGNVVVEGLSNTFEASVFVRVLNGSGDVVHEEYGTATCGSGCWGEYTFVLDPALFDQGASVQVLDFSAENGEAIDVVTVPYNDGMLWDLTGGFTN
jgi:spore germination protein GerM